MFYAFGQALGMCDVVLLMICRALDLKHFVDCYFYALDQALGMCDVVLLMICRALDLKHFVDCCFYALDQALGTCDVVLLMICRALDLKHLADCYFYALDQALSSIYGVTNTELSAMLPTFQKVVDDCTKKICIQKYFLKSVFECNCVYVDVRRCSYIFINSIACT